VTLWHGTTKSAAERIVDRGFEPISVSAMVGEVAQEHGVAESDLFETLKVANRFAAIQHRRDDAMWFATSRIKAINWAQRAPEARWEALWAVWWLTHGGYHHDPSPWLNVDASGWHARQFFADPPVVVEVNVPIGKVKNHLQTPLLSPELLDEIKLEVPELCVAHPVSLEWVVGYEVLPREVEFTAAAGILGLEIAELTRRVNAGVVTPPRQPREAYGCDWYWHLDEFLKLLPEDDQSK
jgi:hypothetical protein